MLLKIQSVLISRLNMETNLNKQNQTFLLKKRQPETEEETHSMVYFGVQRAGTAGLKSESQNNVKYQLVG